MKNYLQYEYYVDTIEDTHVQIVEDGYIVHVFFEQFIGCGPHDTYEIDVHIDTNANMKASWKKISTWRFLNYGMCLD